MFKKTVLECGRRLGQMSARRSISWMSSRPATSLTRSTLLASSVSPSGSASSLNAVRPPVRTHFSYPSPRKLSDIVKLPLLDKESPEDVRLIWEEFHKEKELTVSGFMSANEYRTIAERSKNCQYFVFPVKKGDGYFVLLSQIQDNTAVFTFLDDYRNNPSTAQPYLVLTMYPELLTRAIGRGHNVLTRTDICNQELNKLDVQRIMSLFTQYYVSDSHFRTVEQFNLRPREFDFNEYVRKLL